jgi:ribosomal protein S18 acetylase RimI-like enzyme
LGLGAGNARRYQLLTMSLRFSNDVSEIDWDALVVVFKRAPLGERTAEKLRAAFLNSSIRCFVWQADQLIGAGRAITDGVTYAAIFDVVLLPEFQRKGIGSQIMDRLAIASKAPNIILHASPGKEGFYRKLGYRKMKTAMARFANPAQQEAWGYIE